MQESLTQWQYFSSLSVTGYFSIESTLLLIIFCDAETNYKRTLPHSFLTNTNHSQYFILFCIDVGSIEANSDLLNLLSSVFLNCLQSYFTTVKWCRNLYLHMFILWNMPDIFLNFSCVNILKNFRCLKYSVKYHENTFLQKSQRILINL